MTRAVLSISVLLLTVLFPINAVHAKTLVVAVIDTGIDVSVRKLCKFGHKSFIDKEKDQINITPQDDNGHGTHVADTIVNQAGTDGDYCIVSIKFYENTSSGVENLKKMINAFRYAMNIKADIINISGGGADFISQEFFMVLKALKKGIVIVAAAGNNHEDLDKDCNYYPGCYDKRIVMVGNLKKDFFGNTSISDSSNYGKRVSRWEVGTNVLAALPGGKSGYLTGTSQATAIATGKILKERLGR